MYYIGQIIKQKNKSTFEGTFLQTKTSRDHKGMVYGFPEVRDIYEFNFSQVGKLKKLFPYGRGLFKFNYDWKSII